MWEKIFLNQNRVGAVESYFNDYTEKTLPESAVTINKSIIM